MRQSVGVSGRSGIPTGLTTTADLGTGVAEGPEPGALYVALLLVDILHHMGQLLSAALSKAKSHVRDTPRDWRLPWRLVRPLTTTSHHQNRGPHNNSHVASTQSAGMRAGHVRRARLPSSCAHAARGTRSPVGLKTPAPQAAASSATSTAAATAAATAAPASSQVGVRSLQPLDPDPASSTVPFVSQHRLRYRSTCAAR